MKGNNMKNKIEINCQSSIKIIDKKIIYFDPFKISEELHDADLIFITHDHYDHYDYASILKIKKKDTILVVPESIIDKVSKDVQDLKIMKVIPNMVYNFLGYVVKTIPSYNINKKFHLREYNYVGYLITINDETIYVAGDIDNIEEARKIKPDIALVPIGGTYTMDYLEASNLINEMKPKVVIPTHYKTVVGSYQDAIKFKELVNKDIETIILLK